MRLFPAGGLVFLAMLLPFPGLAGKNETPESLLKKARKVLARVEGEITLPGLKEPVEVLRDRWGIPHIFAKNSHDLFFAQGFVAAQDRLFQLDGWRRLAVGETAEILGPEAIEADRFARLLRYRGTMEAEWASYSPDSLPIARAFTDGINAFIDHAGKRLPIEFQILGYEPKKWLPKDILGRMSGIIMTRNFQQEIMRARLAATVGLDRARLLAPTDPARKWGPVGDMDLNGIGKEVLEGYARAIKPLGFKPQKTESNNWVVSGEKSVSGKPMLASDPHRAIALPALRYLVHLNAPGWNVIGSGEPALPGVAIGHNDHIAWGITIVGTDQADIFVEETNPANPAEYKVGDAWKNMEVIREPVRVRGKAQPVMVELRFTRHGPVLYQDGKRNRAYVLKWVGAEPGGAAYLGSLAVDRARNKNEFLRALKAWKTPSENFVYADVAGNIGWVAAALSPVRKDNHDGLVPVPGNAGLEWQGFLKVEELPQRFNPSEGFIATANHNILYPGYSHRINFDWAPPYRFQRVKQRLEGKKKLDLKDFQSTQHEVTSLPGRALARLIKTVDVQDPVLEPFARLMGNWDGVLSRESKAGPLYAVWLQELEKDFFQRLVPKEVVGSVKGLGGMPLMLAALEKPAGWFASAAERDRLVRATFARAVTRTQKLLGPDPEKWSWGKLHTVTFRHPLAGLGPAYEKAFNLGPVSRPGEGQTPNNTRYDDQFRQIHGATYRHVLDLADWDRGLATSSPGQSGQPGSPHYGDLLPLWGEGKYFPLAFSRKKVEEVTQHRLILKPRPGRP